jgi:hypothetical protein
MIIMCENCFTRQNVGITKDGFYLCKECAAKFKESLTTAVNKCSMQYCRSQDSIGRTQVAEQIEPTVDQRIGAAIQHTCAIRCKK